MRAACGRIILLDLAMPGMDGFEARRRLREEAAAGPPPSSWP